MIGHIFISYAHEDREYCDAIAHAIVEHGLETWYDPSIPQGRRWNDEIRQHIDTCAVLLVLSSRSSARRNSFVHDEVDYARSHEKRIWNLRLDDTPFPHVGRIQGTNVFDRSLPSESWFAELREAVHEVHQSFLRPTIERSFGRPDHLRVAAWSPDGQWIATAGRTQRVKLISVQHDVARVLGEGTAVDHTAAEALAVWSPDSTRLLTGANDGGLRIWTVDGSSSEPMSIPPVHFDDGRVRIGAWSPDSTAIAFVGRQGGGRIFTPGQSGEPIHTVEYQGRISALTWTPGGASVTTGHEDGRIWQFDARTGKPVRDPLAGHADRVTKRINCIAWSPNELRVSTAGDDGLLRVWDWNPADPASEPRPRDIGNHSAPVWGLAWSPDGRYLATASDERACLWDLATGFQFTLPHPQQQVWSVSWSPDRRLVTVDTDGEAHIWSLWMGLPVEA